MKVLFLASWYPNKENPTLGNFIQKHAEAANLYNDVAVLSLVSSPKHSSIEVVQEQTKGFKEVVVYYPKKTSSLKFLDKIVNFSNQYKSFKIGYKLITDTLDSIDIVHLNVTYPAGIWAQRLKRKYSIPFVVTEHSNGFHIGGKHAYSKYILELSKRVLKNASYILPVSNDLKNHLKKLVPNQNYEVISNVVDETIFYQDNHRENAQKRLVHISTGFDPQKNVSGIIRVIDKLSLRSKNFQLHIISDGNITYAKEMVKELKLNDFIVFHSTKTTQEIADFLKSSDALVLFSNYENFPCVIAESFMSGVPVISSNVNGIPEHIFDWNGILVNKGEENELEQVLYDFINGFYDFDSKRMRNYALEHFSYKEVGKAFDTIYRNTLDRQK